jgi:hypothetical protein
MLNVSIRSSPSATNKNPALGETLIALGWLLVGKGEPGTGASAPLAAMLKTVMLLEGPLEFP